MRGGVDISSLSLSVYIACTCVSLRLRNLSRGKRERERGRKETEEGSVFRDERNVKEIEMWKKKDEGSEE